ncbi:tetratricopeptide (TPR) repeat protein [Allocatelliglobosispora scoriae]|uniref:Tetratricopeptide (TPR) repeat protein n=1 Tax=Allocatelliglobosispora scoriae TaxID=643052 RepID=A0A841BRE9_9ACTN|nr:WG repeat-containing protein [Allocatelliglobosispora scoriae]MBB5869493.1 tetratricopeptide (TPR) repeat protein [Allocatelliglobosispora scoriae]
MTDERTDDRHRPTAPAWAGAPTKPWSKVPAQRPHSDNPDGQPVSGTARVPQPGAQAPNVHPQQPGQQPPRPGGVYGQPQQPGQPGPPPQPGPQGQPGQYPPPGPFPPRQGVSQFAPPPQPPAHQPPPAQTPPGVRGRHAAEQTGELPAIPASVSAAPVSVAPAAPAAAAVAPVSEAPVSVAPAPAMPAATEAPQAVATPDTVVPVSAPAAGSATALTAPTMMHAIVRPKQAAATAEPVTTPAEAAAAVAEAVEKEKTPDPEQVLAAIEWRFHHDTLRELVDDPDQLRDVREALTEKLSPATDNATRARLLSLRAVVSRILGDLGKAHSDAKMALVHAEATGELRRIAIAQARLANVLQWRGDFAEADQLFEQANSTELPDRLRATMHEHFGKSCYDQGRYIEACNHFEKALELRKVEDPDLTARTELALDAVFRKVAENGWGPYPRGRDEILRVHKPPVPKFDQKLQCWGYADPSGETGIQPAFADAQPFRDGVAWVRRPESETWELIDEGGQRLIDNRAGWLGVGSFSDGLAWVSRDGTGNWVAIDKTNRIVISTGFDDVRPFRRGIAAVRRGGWGAIDKVGRIVVPCQFGPFATALTDGRYVDGFTDEGLAIVDAGGRKGIVDRAGNMIVPPVHPALVIHPVAFLVASPAGKWGALDRKGRPLIDPQLPSRTVVMEEIDRLLADTKPVL